MWPRESTAMQRQHRLSRAGTRLPHWRPEATGQRWATRDTDCVGCTASSLSHNAPASRCLRSQPISVIGVNGAHGSRCHNVGILPSTTAWHAGEEPGGAKQQRWGPLPRRKLPCTCLPDGRFIGVSTHTSLPAWTPSGTHSRQDWRTRSAPPAIT